MACQSKIVRVIRAAVLFCDNVLNVVSQFTILLRDQAVLATVSRALANQTTRGGIHPLSSVGFQLPLRLELQDGNNVGGVDDRFVVGSFVFVKKPIITFFRKDSDLLLKGRPDTKLCTPRSPKSAAAA